MRENIPQIHEKDVILQQLSEYEGCLYAMKHKEQLNK